MAIIKLTSWNAMMYSSDTCLNVEYLLPFRYFEDKDVPFTLASFGILYLYVLVKLTVENVLNIINFAFVD